MPSCSEWELDTEAGLVFGGMVLFSDLNTDQ